MKHIIFNVIFFVIIFTSCKKDVTDEELFLKNFGNREYKIYSMTYLPNDANSFEWLTNNDSNFIKLLNNNFYQTTDKYATFVSASLFVINENTIKLIYPQYFDSLTNTTVQPTYTCTFTRNGDTTFMTRVELPYRYESTFLFKLF